MRLPAFLLLLSTLFICQAADQAAHEPSADAEFRALMKDQPASKKTAARFLDLAKRFPKTEPARDALLVLATNEEFREQAKSEAEKAKLILAQDFPEASEFVALVARFWHEEETREKKMAAAKNEAESDRLWKELAPPREPWLAYARNHPGTPLTARALAWWLNHAQEEANPEILAALERDHLSNGLAGFDAIRRLGRFSDRGLVSERLLRAVMLANPSSEDRLRAELALAWWLSEKAWIVEALKSETSDGRFHKSITKHEGQSALDELLKRDAGAMRAEVGRLFEHVAANGQGVKNGRFGISRWGDIAENAKSELFALRNLIVGKVAPEIVGVDVDGKRFKLSDYRGKVVLIDFWGDW